MKILLVADSPFVPTAYAIQATALADTLGSAGHEIFYYAPSYQGVARQTKTFKLVGDLAGVESLTSYYASLFDVDCILTYSDPFVHMDAPNWGKPWVALAPIDTEPASPVATGMLQFASHIICLTRQGQKALADANIKDTYYAPCGINYGFWSAGDRTAARHELGLSPDTFFALFVGVNTGETRKNLDSILVAWNQFTYELPDVPLKLMLHTEIERGGLHVPYALQALNIPRNTIQYTEPATYRAGLSPDGLRLLYTAADVLIAPSAGEGFHVPVVEAAACGTPSITSKFTAGREINGGAGWQIPIDSGQMQFMMGRFAYWFRPNFGAIVHALHAAYAARHDVSIKARAKEWAAQYDLKRVHHMHWLPTIAKIEQELKGAKLDTA